MKRALRAVLAVVALLEARAVRAAPAQCTGYLVPREARLWTDAEKDLPRAGERGDFLPAVIRRGWDPGLGVNLQKGFRLVWLGGCRPEDGERVGESKRVHLVLLDGGTESFEEVWALPSELLTFNYEYPEGRDGPENVAAIRKAAALAVGGIGAGEFKRPGIANRRGFAAPFEATWRALVETLASQGWHVGRIDRASGMVATLPEEDKGDGAMTCAGKHDGRSTVLLNVLAESTPGGARVTVNTAIVAMNGRDVVACYSNGTLEKALLDGIGKRLAAAAPAR